MFATVGPICDTTRHHLQPDQILRRRLQPRILMGALVGKRNNQHVHAVNTVQTLQKADIVCQC